MSPRPNRAPRLELAAPSAGKATGDARGRVLEQAVDWAVRAPSVHNTQPWRIELRPDRMVMRADRTRQLTTLDPIGRELVQSVGAALFNVRVALAARGWAAEVHRLPRPDDPDLLAEVWPVLGPPDTRLAALAPEIPRRRTNRRRFTGGPVPDEVLHRLTEIAEQEGVLLLPVLHEAHRTLVGRLTQQADRLQNADPAYRAELRFWTTRDPSQGDGVPAGVVAHVDGKQHDDLPLRDFDTRGVGALPPDTRSSTDQTLVLLATRLDDQLSWLRAGEALEHVLLELTRLHWVADPLTQAVEVPVTRTQLRAALSWDAHPQMLLRIGSAAPTEPTPRRRRGDVIAGGPPSSGPLPIQEPPAPTGWPVHGRSA
jgi:hypothetical protein